MELSPGYVLTEFGELPEQWRVATLEELQPFVTSGSRGWAEFYSERGLPFLRITNMSRASIYLDLTDLKFVNLPAGANEGTRTALKAGDVLISITADIGIVAYVDDVVPMPAFINQHIALVRFEKAKADARFVSYFLAGERAQQRFRSSTDVGAKAGMSLLTVRKLAVALPPLAEQRAIAAALGDVDALLASLDKLIAKKRDLKQAAMQQLLTGRTRLPGFSGKWDTGRLGEHVQFLRNGTHARAELDGSSSTRYLHYGDIHTSSSVRMDLGLEAVPRLSSGRARSLDRLAQGDLVFVDASEDMVGVGKAVEVILPVGVEAVAGLHTIACRFDRELLADGFKAYLPFMPPFREQLTRLAAGTKVYSTSHRHIAGITMALPNLSEQKAIAAVLSDMDAELDALERRREKTVLIKQGMMQELLSGRTRLV